MKNYYDILGLSKFENNQDIILKAYKDHTATFQRSLYKESNIREHLIVLNEAYLVLSDVNLKNKYDYALSASDFSTIKDSLLEKHKQATDFILSKLPKAPQKKKKGVFAAVFCSLLLISAFGTILRTCTESYLNSNPQTKSRERILPKGFEDFESVYSNAEYRVFATYPDSIYGFDIKALMIAYIDTINKKLDSRTTFILKHRSGWSKSIETKKYSLLDLNDFRAFVNGSAKKDTIITLLYDCNILAKKSFNISEISGRPFVFMDVSFKGYPSLLIESKRYQDEIYKDFRFYDVYGFASGKVSFVNFAPYNSFKTATHEWMLGSGTNIDYVKKEIIVPSLKDGSCSDCGEFIYDHYILDESSHKFTHFQSSSKYGIGN